MNYDSAIFKDITLPTVVQQYMHLSRYSRWSDTLKRRETWYETVKRYLDFMTNKVEEMGYVLTEEEYLKQMEYILNLKAMPSMRALMSSGPALEDAHVACYNCAFCCVNHPKVFSESMYILMCGTGLGYSIERQEIAKLPEIQPILIPSDTIIVFRDSKIGWAQGYQLLIDSLYNGEIPKWDLSKIRPAGARLKKFGGRASGPQPLEELILLTVDIFKRAAGRKLNSLEIHSIMCKIGDCVVSGGVRRSALLSLSNLSDDRMRNAKSGEWWKYNPHFALANNSVSYEEKPDMERFFDEWLSLYKSKSGERGIFNREGARKFTNQIGRRNGDLIKGVNPCAEILMRDCGFCNLSEVVARFNDTLSSLCEKVRIAVQFGVAQSCFTDFKYIRSIWKRNAEEERLLGVSLTGIMDHPVLSGSMGYEELIKWLEAMKAAAIDEAKKWSERLGISMPAALTCVKPSGSVSQLVNSSSGIHPRYSRYYVRTYRENKISPICSFFENVKVPSEPAIGKESITTVFEFPIECPPTSVTRDQMTALQQLEIWKIYKHYWAEHTVSVTVYVREHEWLEVGAWVYKNFDDITGISFLPYDTGIYKQAPYQPIEEAEYKELCSKFPEISWIDYAKYEKSDMTENSRELACAAGHCEL